MENIEYHFKCGNDKLISCHGEHKVSTDDVLNCIFTILIRKGEITENDLTESFVNDYFLRVKTYMNTLTGNIFSHFNSIQIDLEIAIAFLDKQK